MNKKLDLVVFNPNKYNIIPLIKEQITNKKDFIIWIRLLNKFIIVDFIKPLFILKNIILLPHQSKEIIIWRKEIIIEHNLNIITTNIIILGHL